MLDNLRYRVEIGDGSVVGYIITVECLLFQEPCDHCSLVAGGENTVTKTQFSKASYKRRKHFNT